MGYRRSAVLLLSPLALSAAEGCATSTGTSLCFVEVRGGLKESLTGGVFIGGEGNAVD